MTEDTKREMLQGLSAWAAVAFAKIVGAAHLMGISTWGEAASAMAFAYTGLLALGWLYRNVGRPAWLWVRRGHERRRRGRREV